MITPVGGGARIAVERPFASHPSWSPDGTRIAYVADARGSGTLSVLYLAEAAADLVGLGATGFIDWSPGGDRIAYTSASDNKAELFIHPVGITPGSIGRAQRISTDGSVSYPDWSPDGAQLAFVSRYEGNENIHVATLGCTDGDEACQVDVRQITGAPDAETNPIWFPDGKHLLYLAGSGSSWRLEFIDVDSLVTQVVLDGLTSPDELDGYVP